MTFKTNNKNVFRGLEIHQDRPVKQFPAVQIAVILALIVFILTCVKMCNEPSEISVHELNARR